VLSATHTIHTHTDFRYCDSFRIDMSAVQVAIGIVNHVEKSALG